MKAAATEVEDRIGLVKPCNFTILEWKHLIGG